MTGESATRFWSKVQKRGSDDCWNWTGGRSGSGYGSFYCYGKGAGAHRVSWEWANGEPIPPGMFVCHHCDNRLCVNPAHLFLGTNRDNMQDAARKGRNAMQINPKRSSFHGPRNPDHQVRGERNGRAKLTEREVVEIRSLSREGLSSPAIAAKFGIVHGHVLRIVARKVWAHVPECAVDDFRSERGNA